MMVDIQVMTDIFLITCPEHGNEQPAISEIREITQSPPDAASQSHYVCL